MNNDKTFTQRQLPFMLNCNPATKDPNAKVIEENTKLELGEVMKCTSIKVDVDEAGELTPEAQEELIGGEY